MKKILVLALVILSCYQAEAQKAVLYKFKFKVPDAYMKNIINYDENGNIAYIERGGVQVQDVHRQQLAEEQVKLVCESMAQLVEELYNYKEVEILYPKVFGSTATSNILDDFPNKSYKRTVKKYPADGYVEVEINLKDKMVGHPGDPEEDNEELEMRFELISEMTVYDSKGAIIDEKAMVHTGKLEGVFDGKYDTELRENGTFVVRRPYFLQEDIISIFNIVKDDYVGTM